MIVNVRPKKSLEVKAGDLIIRTDEGVRLIVTDGGTFALLNLRNGEITTAFHNSLDDLLKYFSEDILEIVPSSELEVSRIK